MLAIAQTKAAGANLPGRDVIAFSCPFERAVRINAVAQLSELRSQTVIDSTYLLQGALTQHFFPTM
jgi:hypothetical protein